MSTTLSDQFQANGGSAVVIDGQLVVPAKSLPLAKGSWELSLSMKPKLDVPEQGVVIVSKGGILSANSVKASKFVLWCESCPSPVYLTLTMKRDGEVLLWNVWRDNGVTQAWVRDAGLTETATAGGFVLNCSGPGRGPTFDDLTVDVVLKAS